MTFLEHCLIEDFRLIQQEISLKYEVLKLLSTTDQIFLVVIVKAIIDSSQQNQYQFYLKNFLAKQWSKKYIDCYTSKSAVL